MCLRLPSLMHLLFPYIRMSLLNIKDITVLWDYDVVYHHCSVTEIT